MLGFLYFGRLEKEKGFDAIIDMILRFGKEGDELPFQLFVFGAGTYETQIQYLAHKYQTIHFFGRQPRDTIRRYVSNCNFLLSPSTCLETFGLSALTGILRDLPAIGFAKGGNAPFIEPALDLRNVNGQTLGEKLYFLVHQLNKAEFFKASLPITEIIEKHKKENWKANMAYLLDGKKKILIASDFTNKIGGLETYINDAKEILEDMGYEVKLFGIQIPAGKRGKLCKTLGFVTAIFNLFASIHLRWKIKRWKPDVIRFHSVLRYLGRLPVRTSKRSKAEKWMMYHDLGYFYPYPSKLENENQIQYPFTLKNLIQSAHTKNPFKKFAIMCKYLVTKPIQKQLKKRIKIHLVPSDFIKPILHKSYGVTEENITVFPHFIQE